MVQNNKVLTVSYGTFSCTLEGFEDSFDTMKAIAEYFRDLAADDRYFGAEPPQPDAEMMARIAQREIARQVEARSSDSGIHLRAAAAAPAAPAQVATPDATPAAETHAEPQLEETATEDPDAVEPVADSPATTAEIADQIAEDREAVAETTAEETDTASDSVLADVSSALRETRTEDLAADADEADDIQDDTQADLADDLMAEDVLDPTPRSEDTVPATDSIAAKLQRIRAVVAKTPNRSEEFIEDEHADAVSTGENDLPEDVATAFEDDLRDDEPFEDEATHEESVSDILDRLDLTGARVDAPASDDATDAEDESDAETVSETMAQDTLSDESADEPEAQAQPVRPQRPLKARTIRVTRNVQATPEDSDAAEPEADEPEAQNASDATAAAPSAEAESHANPAEEKPAAAEAPAEPIRPRRPVRGRVIRVKRAQADGSLIDATAEDVTPRREPAADAPKAIAPAAPKESSLSEDEEADLMAELAAVEAELMASSGSQADAAPAEEDAFEEDHAEVAPEALAAAERPAREILTSSDASTDGDVSRLMAAADDRLSDEDAASSRETYNQLRAAVAAAQADTGESDDARREARTRAFREDLAHVVRPSRGGSDDGAARSASQARPAPLKLVAEQRIDPAPEEKPAAAAQAQPSDTPVRPRRVSSVLMGSDEDDSAPAARQQDGAFATYATEKGAVELHELLEAAASYMSFVEGRESFSRPQLINKVRMLEGQDDFNREDSLRSFGMLLREGKLKKASNGRFSVSSQIGFRPGNRAAG